MATTTKTMARTAATTNTATVLYTVPNSTTAVVTNIVIANTSASAQTATISLDGVVLVPTVSLPANSQYSWDGKQPLDANKTITGGASATSVTFHIGGVEIA